MHFDDTATTKVWSERLGAEIVSDAGSVSPSPGRASIEAHLSSLKNLAVSPGTRGRATHTISAHTGQRS